jgi:uncharacterized protein (DUF924 family)
MSAGGETSTGFPRAQEVLDFWFGPEPLAADELPHRLSLWFGSEDPPEVLALRDETITRRFGALVEAAASGELDSWQASPRRLLALILLLDQFPRHIFRGKSRAFAQDARAMAFSLDGLQTGADAALLPIERLFFYLPLQHCESRAVQEESIAAFRRLAIDAPPGHRELFDGCLRFAEQHFRVIERFGRFPHRNAALARRSTTSELNYLHTGEGL